MKTAFLARLSSTALALCLLLPAPIQAQSSAADPMVGTGGDGHTFPGATAPFGMVQLSPDTDTGCEIRACYGHAADTGMTIPPSRAFRIPIFRARAIPIWAMFW
jgi:putative alpha-1,2-mannosidase